MFVEQKVKEKTNRLANSKYYSVSKVYEQNKETILGQVDMMSTLG